MTRNAYLELLRFAYHLVSVVDLPLVFTEIGDGARIEAWADSPMAFPDDDCRSPGGYLVRLEHPDGRYSGPLACSSQTMTATGGSELEQVVRARPSSASASTSARSSSRA
jgi:hypothetical protein